MASDREVRPPPDLAVTRRARLSVESAAPFQHVVARESGEPADQWVTRAIRSTRDAAFQRGLEVKGLRIHGRTGPNRPSTSKTDVLVVTIDPLQMSARSA